MANKKKNKFLCPICKRLVSDEDEGLQCDGRCDTWYHTQCAGVSDETYRSLGLHDKWYCGSCDINNFRKEKANNGSTNRKSCDTDTESETRPETQHKPGKVLVANKVDLRKLDPGLQELGRTLNQVTSILTELQKTANYQSAQYDDFYQQMKSLQTDSEVMKKRLNELEASNKTLTEDNVFLRKKVNMIDQLMLSKEIEIQGISEAADENLTDTVIELCTALRYALSKEDILSAHRLPEPKLNRAANRTQQKRPRPIVVKFVNEKIPKEILNAKKASKVTGQQIGKEDHTIFVNERLTQTNKRLFWMARQTKNLGYKFSWVKNGQVYVRKDEKSLPIRIDREEDIPTNKVGPPATQRLNTSSRKKSEGNNSDGESYLST